MNPKLILLALLAVALFILATGCANPANHASPFGLVTPAANAQTQIVIAPPVKTATFGFDYPSPATFTVYATTDLSQPLLGGVDPHLPSWLQPYAFIQWPVKLVTTNHWFTVPATNQQEFFVVGVN